MNESYKINLIFIGSSVAKTLLVAGLVLSFGWVLVQIAEWKTKKPAVVAEADGSIILLADNAEIIGVGTARANLYAGKRNIGWWNDTSQSLVWTFDVTQPGIYHVFLEYSLPQNYQTDFEIKVSDKVLSSTAMTTGAWDAWNTVDAGEIELMVGDKQRLTLTPIKTSKRGVMNFASLKLKLKN